MELTPNESNESSLIQTNNKNHRLPRIHSADPTSKYHDGLTYTIQNNRYMLPSSNVTRAMSAHQTGNIEAWPANTGGGSRSFKALALNNKDRLVSIGIDLKGKLDTTSKPKFLAKIEENLYDELKKLNVEESKANETRLEVYRQAFQSIIDDFKTYKPLLSSIKKEYEIMLEHLRKRIEELEPVRQQMFSLSEQHNKQLMNDRLKERGDIFLLKEEKKRLQQTIRELTNQNQNLETNTQRLQEEVAKQYELYRKEIDAKKLLITDANDLRFQQERRIDEKQGYDEQGIKREDPVMMKLSLKQARKDLDAALAKVIYMETNYNDVVPRRDFIALEVKSNEYVKQIKELQDISNNQSREIEQLRTQIENLRDDVQRLQREKDELSVKNENIHDEMTPRPSWHLAGDVIDGGAERWQNVTANKTSQEKLVALLNEFTGGGNDDDSSGNQIQNNQVPDQLPPYGEGEQVPFHLRSSKSVKNRRLTRRDIAVLIQEIWTERRLSDKQNGRTKNLSEFVYEFFRNRYGNHNTAVEMSYNLDYSCKRFKHNDNCQLFHQILSGEADEGIYHHTKNLIEQLADRIIKENEGSVINEQLNQILKKYLPNKSSNDISELIVAAEKEQPNEEKISLGKLFSVDDEDNYGELVRVLKRQLNEDKQSYIHDVKEKLEVLNSINAKDMEQAVRSVHPSIKPNELATIVQWTFEAKDGSQIPSMSLNDVLQRLQNGVFYRQHTLSS